MYPPHEVMRENFLAQIVNIKLLLIVLVLKATHCKLLFHPSTTIGFIIMKKLEGKVALVNEGMIWQR
jgi:hypothetical protein